MNRPARALAAFALLLLAPPAPAAPPTPAPADLSRPPPDPPPRPPPDLLPDPLQRFHRRRRVPYYPKSLPGPSIQDSYDAIGCPIDKRDAFRIRAEEMRDELKDG
ncbi:MAG: hypothetical protein H6701_09070 [Myxococcales bacterium]|nr:hypothetical protein [Myxococcales bacterium]